MKVSWVDLAAKTQILGVFFTLWHVFCSIDFEVQGSPSHRDARWHQKVTFYVVLLLVRPPLLSLGQRGKDLWVHFHGGVRFVSMMVRKEASVPVAHLQCPQ